VPYSGKEESPYSIKCRDLKRKIIDVEAENDVLALKIDCAKRGIARMRLERTLLLEKVEEKKPVNVDDSERSDSESSVRPPFSPRDLPSSVWLFFLFFIL
jgi:non-histone protein 10